MAINPAAVQAAKVAGPHKPLGKVRTLPVLPPTPQPPAGRLRW